jgi:hypothetical protein
MAKEIFCCELAILLDLPVPKYDIVNLSDSELSGFYSDTDIRKFEEGYKFCSKKLEQYAEFNFNVSESLIKEYEFAGIFAFDVLVQNGDRHLGSKPNLLINNDSLVMIDHELTLSFINESGQPTDYENNICIYPFNNHTLIKHLKNVKEKSHIFDEFIDNVKMLNISKLNSVFDEMEHYNIEFGDKLDYFLYLDWCKKNYVKINNYLLGMI